MATSNSNVEKQYLTEKDLLSSGSILKEYTQEDFISVVPAPAIGRVKFSIIKQGTSGKEHNDFYMDMEKFRLLTQDLCSASGIKKLSESADHQYPDAFKFTTGTDGSKHLNIGGGRKGVRIQIQEKSGDKWNNKMVTIPHDSLRSMKFRFELVMGLVPVSHYYMSLVDAFWEGMNQRNKFFSSYDESQDGNCTSEEIDKRTNTLSESSKNSNPAEEKKKNKPSIEVISFGFLMDDNSNGFYLYARKKTDDSLIQIHIPEESIRQMGQKKFKIFSDAVCSNPVSFRFTGKKTKNADGEVLYTLTSFA